MLLSAVAGRSGWQRAILAGCLAVLLGFAMQSAALASMSFTTTAGWRLLPVPQIHQTHGLSCEAAALQMALAYQGIGVNQDAILNAMGIDRRAASYDIAGNFHWGDPYDAFVGNPDGSERGLTGYGTYFPTVVKAAQAYGASVSQAGEGIQPPAIYQAILTGHPVVAWVAFDWKWHQVTHYRAYDNDVVQFGSPYEHAVTLIGVTTDNLLVNNPWFGQQWVSKSTFEASYGTFNHMAVIMGARAADPGANMAVTPYQGTTPVPSDSFHALTPARILDTRSGLGAGSAAPLGGNSTMSFQVTGQGGVPPAGVSSVVLNITATNTTGSSYLTVFPNGMARPNTSSLNWSPGSTVPNLAIMPVGPDGRIAAYNLRGTVDVVADVAGWMGPSPGAPTLGLFNALSPSRILDTRNGTGGFRSSLGQGATLTLQVAGRGGVPASGVSAVALNITATNPTASSFLTAYPTGVQRPASSNLNFIANQTVPNRVIVATGSGGQVSLYNFQGSADIVVDVSGWFTDGAVTNTGSRYTAVVPQRILDTRTGLGAVPPGATGTTQMVDTTGMNLSAVVLNVTVTDPTSASFLTLWPGGDGRPVASDLNFVPGQTVPNLVVVKLGPYGPVNFYNLTGYTNLIIDLAGYFGPPG